LATTKKLLLLLFILLSYRGVSQEKVTIANVDKAFALIFSDPKQAKADLDQLEIRAKTQNDSLYSIILNNKGVYYAVQTQMDSAFYFFNKSSALADKAGKRYLGTQNNIAIIYKKKGEMDKAIALLRANLLIANDKNFNAVRATIYGELASCYAAKEWHKQSLEYLLQSIEIWGNEDPIPTKKIAVEKQKLANLYYKMGSTIKALSIYNEILPIFKKLDDLYNFYLVKITLANINLEINQPKKALLILQDALPNLEKFNDKELLLYAYEREARSIEAIGNKSFAQQKYAAAIAFGLKHNQIETVNTVINYGNLMLKSKDSIALLKLKRQTETPVFKKLLTLNTTKDQMQYYQWLEKFAQLTKDKPTEIVSLERVENLKFLLIQKNNFKRIDELDDLQYFVKNTAKQASNQDRMAFGTLIILLSALIAFLFYKKLKSKRAFLKLRLEKTKKQNEFEEQLQQVQQLLSTTLKTNIKVQESELFTNTLKNLKWELISQNAKNKNSTPQKQDINYVELKNELQTLIIQFQNINPDFFTILQKQYPLLSKNERHFCCLIKLHFSNKEIAQLTKITVESVITKKYRIVKKLELDKDLDFYLWLNSLD
jgi:DNA-binding CsgD family transcriptional regulator